MGRWNVILSGLVPHECKPPLPILLVLEYELVAFAFVILNLPDLRGLKSYRLNFLCNRKKLSFFLGAKLQNKTFAPKYI